jgi:uncharacterized protein YbaA (DUF1428 family)
MPRYVDGFLIAIPTSNLEAYKKIAKKAGKVWREHGALEYRECVANDLTTQMGVPFDKRVKARPGETVLFSWIVYKSKAHRDRVNKKVMNDPRLEQDANSMPFDAKRMTYGGFEVLVDA